jgi:PAS domain S-box-containing protein
MSDPLPSPPLPPTAPDLLPRQETLQAGLDLIDQGFTLIDSQLRMVAWNRTFLRLLDFPDELAYVGAPFEGFMRYNAQRGEYGPGDPERQVQERMAAASRFTAHTLERTRPDGSVLLVRGVPVPGHGFVTLYSDITAQRAAERQIQQHAAVLEQRVAERTAELHRSEAQMRLITDSIPALVAYFDRDRNYRYINRGYKAWFGLDPAHPERVSAKAYLGAATYAGIRPNVAQALAGRPVSYEYEVDVASGARLVARTTLIPEVDAQGQVAGCFELTFDITEQKRSQAMLVQAQKMEALGQLTGGLAHDFNNILTVVIGNLEGLRRARPDDPAMAESIEPALLAAHRGADLIRRLMSFSRQQPLAAKATDVGRLLDEVARLVRRTLPEDRQLDLRPCTTSVWAWADAHQLQNSLLNLIFNARDATAAGGRIALGLEVHDVAATAAAELGLRPGPHVRLVVSDNGCGMDRTTQERVFEPFFTTKPPGHGTGLGLAMVYGFITQSAGAIRIDSAPGAGTRVSLWLPACEAPLEDGDAESPVSPVPAGSRGLALLVEDDAAVRQVVRRDLLALGFAVLEAENGPEALDILDCTPAITLVLTDGVMPGGVDGRQVVAHARRQRVPQVLLMSGYAPGASPDEGLPILPKPFTREQLAARLESGDGR